MKVTMKKKRGARTYEAIVEITFDNRDPITWKSLGDADSIGEFVDNLPDRPEIDELENTEAADHVTSMIFKVLRCPR